MPLELTILDASEVHRELPTFDVVAALRRMFVELAGQRASQPPQSLTAFPDGSGDFIAYSGVLAGQRTFGVKLSPYIAGDGQALVTAWTLLVSMNTGQPLMLCDSKQLTTERTAATTALAVDLLARAGASRLAIIGTGPVAQAHLRYGLGLRPWSAVIVVGRTADRLSADLRNSFLALDHRVTLTSNLAEAVSDADVIMLCTSSAQAVIDPATLATPALITSISTNAPRAHEIPPERLVAMDVYCDYRATTPGSAGEMLIAAERHHWDAASIIGDLPELDAGAAPLPAYDKHVFFRSIGLGLEDIAIASEVYRAVAERQARAR